MWWRAGESQSSSPTSDDDGSRGTSNAPSAGGSGGNVRGHSYTEHEQPLQQQSQREQQQQQQQFPQHHPHGAGGNPSQEVPFGNLFSPYQQYEQHYPAAVVWGKRPQQPIIQGLAHGHQQPPGQIVHGQLASNLRATGGPPSHYDKLALGSLTSECTSDYAHRSTSSSTPIPSTGPACDSSTTLREAAAALSANKYGRVFTQGDSAGSYVSSFPQATVAPPSDDPTHVQDRTRNLSSPGLAVHDARDPKISGVAPMLPRVFPAGESRGRGQWSDGSQGTPFGVTLVEGSAGVPGAHHGYQAPGRLPSVSRLLGNVRNARGPTVALGGSSGDDQHTRSPWGGGVVGGAVRTTPPDLPPVGGPSPLQQQQHLASTQQQQRPSIIPSSSMGISQQAQQLYPSLLTHPAAAYMYAPGSPFIGERAPTIPGEVGISSRWEVDESDARGIRQLPSETYPKRPLPAPSGISSPLIEPTGVAPPAPAAVGMGGNSADIGLGPEQHVAADVVGIESYHLRQFGGCIVEGCQEPLVVASTSTSTTTADAATLVGAPTAIPETRRFCARHIGLSMAYFKRHSSASSESSLPGQQQYYPPYVRGFSFSAPGTTPASGSDAVSRNQGRTKSTGRSGGSTGTGTRGGGRCEFPDCTTQPRYATQGSTRPQFCGLHKLPGQVNVVSRCCKHAGCNKVPHFGNNQERPLYCGEHKLEGMVNVANRRCRWVNENVLMGV